MKSKTRDNLIYLTVGLGVAALLVADLIYSESHGREMWMPSRFAIRAFYSTILIGYFVGREAHKAKVKVVHIIGCILLGSILQLTIVFSFRNIIDQLSGISFAALAVLELFVLMQFLSFVMKTIGSSNL
jgi:hypothetical protein